MGAFVLFHLHDDGAGFRILRREALQVALQMRLDLAFGLGQKAQIPARAESACRIAQCERSGVPEWIEQAQAPAQFGYALLSPGEVLGFLACGLRQGARHRSIVARQRLPLIQRLRADLAAVVHPHQRSRMALFGVGELRLGKRAPWQGPRRHRGRRQRAQDLVEFDDQFVDAVEHGRIIPL